MSTLALFSFLQSPSLWPSQGILQRMVCALRKARAHCLLLFLACLNECAP